MNGSLNYLAQPLRSKLTPCCSLAAAEACRWVTKVVPDAPYVTNLNFVDNHGCQYVVHGDDITSDSGGEDCYRFVKQANRMKIVKRTPDISTTDLVGRMLLCTKQHHMKALHMEFTRAARSGSAEMETRAAQMAERIQTYASDETGLQPGIQISFCTRVEATSSNVPASPSDRVFRFLPFGSDKTNFHVTKKPDQHFVYVDGSFDLFSSGHIEFLRRVKQIEREEAREAGWENEVTKKLRMDLHGHDYDRAFVVAGIHDDATVNDFKGSNYPIMNIYERGLCVLQCRYIDAVIFGVPYDVDKPFMDSLPLFEKCTKVYHGKTNFFNTDYDGYTYPKQQGILREVPPHSFQNVNAAQIYRRIMDNRDKFEERQRKKGVKGVNEAEARRIEIKAEEASRKG